ncbi:YbjN domain-containing protein [Aquihabitans sp. McL0605]|uniref:YbjN domain-containing protein n=1 Tax=Aquihabitans sp. McL0605 TaxID=3415671 RepID=UPI003CF680C4
MTDPATEIELARAGERIDAWAARELAGNPVVAAVERDASADVARWYVRVHGEEKDVFTLWLTLRQRSLHHETYVMPAPEENHGQLYEHLLRRNQKLHAMAFAIGIEDAVFLQGQVPVETVTDDELDRILGSTYAYVEQCFRPAMRIGFASRFHG